MEVKGKARDKSRQMLDHSLMLKLREWLADHSLRSVNTLQQDSNRGWDFEWITTGSSKLWGLFHRFVIFHIKIVLTILFVVFHKLLF